MPKLSNHIANRKPTAIRNASVQFALRQDDCRAINVAIGNVSLPMHPAMQERLRHLTAPESPFADGIVRYAPTLGLSEARQAFRNIIGASGYYADNLYIQVTDGGSQAMELVIVACCGDAGNANMPAMLIDAAYTNYRSFAQRLGRRIVSFPRRLDEEGNFNLPSLQEIEEIIQRERPNALVVIPYDNPTGQLYTHQMLVDLAKLCVKYDMWMISDEAYRELYYVDHCEGAVSIWALTEMEVPGITGLRISIETASKVWNGCGLRVGALVTDCRDLHLRLVAENTVNLCTNTLGQWIFGAIAHLSHGEIRAWFQRQRDHYRPLMEKFHQEMEEALPGVIVSRADASLYEVTYYPVRLDTDTVAVDSTAVLSADSLGLELLFGEDGVPALAPAQPADSAAQPAATTGGSTIVVTEEKPQEELSRRERRKLRRQQKKNAAVQGAQDLI